MSRTRRDHPTIALISDTGRDWPKYRSVQAMPMATRRELADYLTLIEPSCPRGIEEGLFGVGNILHRAGLTFADLGRHVFSEDEEARLAA